MRLEPRKAVTVVYSTLALHNWLISKQENGSATAYADDNPSQSPFIPFVDQEDASVGIGAKKMREEIRDFFNNEGTRDWQLSKIYAN